jgi:hypothetical protein
LTESVMDPLSQYGAFAFLPYSNDPHSESVPSKPATTLQSLPIEEEPLEVHNASSWTYCGPVLTPSGAHLPSSFHVWSSLTFSAPSTLLDRLLPLLAFLQDFLSSAGAHHYWLTVRATKPIHEFDTPRWHTDDNFFTQNADTEDAANQVPTPSNHWKLAATLLGPSTLFLTASEHGRNIQSEAKRNECKKRVDHMCTSMRCVGCSDAGEAVRQTLARALCDEQVMRPAQGEVAFFRIGDEEGAVHSEPRCDVDRVFVNVTPGTEADLRALMARLEMGFPRAWCFGMPVGFVGSDEMGVAETKEVKEREERRSKSARVTDVEERESESARAGGTKGGLREECEAWLERRGFGFGKVFS